MTKIQWADETANWIVEKNENIEFVPKVLDDLLKSKRSRRVFAPSMSDPFHPGVKTEWLDQFIATVGLTPHITYQLLTKRPERMYNYFDWCDRRHGETAKPISFCRVDKIEQVCRKIENYPHFDIPKWPLPNLYLGVSVENQAAADERIPWLIKTPAEFRFLSCEPLLETIDLRWFFLCEPNLKKSIGGISQLIIGGESGPNARPFNLDWARSLRDQCQESGVKFFMKQAGSNVWDGDRQLKLRDRKGGDLMELPENLRIREIL